MRRCGRESGPVWQRARFSMGPYAAIGRHGQLWLDKKSSFGHMYRVRPLTSEMTLHITVSHPAETSISVHTMQLYNCYQAYRNNQNSRFCLEHFGQIGSVQQAAQFLYIFAWFLCIAHQTRRNLHLNAKPAPQKLDSLVSSANPDRFYTALDTKKLGSRMAPELVF